MRRNARPPIAAAPSLMRRFLRSPFRRDFQQGPDEGGAFLAPHSSFVIHHFPRSYSSSFRRPMPKVASCCLISFRLVCPKFLQPSSSSSVREASSPIVLILRRCSALRLRTESSRSPTLLAKISGGALPDATGSLRGMPTLLSSAS